METIIKCTKTISVPLLSSHGQFLSQVFLVCFEIRNLLISLFALSRIYHLIDLGKQFKGDQC